MSSVTQFLPHSVFMRRLGLVRDNEQRYRQVWVPTVVLERREQKRKEMAIRKKLSAFNNLMEPGAWAAETARYEEQQDAPFIAMSWPEWRAQQDRELKALHDSGEENSNTRRALYAHWHRINHKKYAADDAAKAPAPKPVIEYAPYYPSQLMTLRRDFIETPEIYFSNEDEQRAALEELEAEIMKTPSAWRLAAEKLQDTVIEVAEEAEEEEEVEPSEDEAEQEVDLEMGLPAPAPAPTPEPEVVVTVQETPAAPAPKPIPGTVRMPGCKTPASYTYCYCEFCYPRKPRKVRVRRQICYCGDDECRGDCGTRECGRCIDCCRCGYDEGYMSDDGYFSD